MHGSTENVCANGCGIFLSIYGYGMFLNRSKACFCAQVHGIFLYTGLCHMFIQKPIEYFVHRSMESFCAQHSFMKYFVRRSREYFCANGYGIVLCYGYEIFMYTGLWNL